MCPSCGNPREKGGETAFDFGGTTPGGRAAGPEVSDPALVDVARAGADWHCARCGAANRAGVPACVACGAAPEAATASPAVPPPARRSRWPLVLGGVLAVALCGGGVVAWLQSEADEPGTVRAMAWETTTRRDAWAPTVAEGWRTDLAETPMVRPVGGAGERGGVANVRDCSSRVHHTVQVACGTEQDCRPVSHQVQDGTRESCTVRDLGNGFAEETCTDVPVYRTETRTECTTRTRYCDEPVYAEWCRYDTWTWTPVETRTLAGTDADPRWVDLPVGEGERLARSGTYRVEVAWGEGEVATPETGSEAAFRRWAVGGPALVRVDRLGNVEGVRLPGDPEPE